ncbi:hypothetical protein AAY473_017820 [Plecturocebus cupreus]
MYTKFRAFLNTSTITNKNVLLEGRQAQARWLMPSHALSPRLEYSGVISAHCNSTSQVQVILLPQPSKQGGQALRMHRENTAERAAGYQISDFEPADLNGQVSEQMCLFCILKATCYDLILIFTKR